MPSLVGSEMCIRDSTLTGQEYVLPKPPAENSDSSPEMHAARQGNQEESSEHNESDWMSRMEENN